MKKTKKDRILILDFGSQYTQLIARRVREAGVYSEVHPYDFDPAKILEFKPSGIILSGGPESVTENYSPRAPDLVFTLGVPVLGICYGMQTMAIQLGGEVSCSDIKEFGLAHVDLQNSSALWRNIEGIKSPVWMSHGDKVTRLPAGFGITGVSDNTDIAAMSDEVRQFYAIQFHLEVTHTVAGETMLSNFIHEICGCASSWNQTAIIEDSIQAIKEQVGTDTVILGLSGGVDSSVAAALLHQAIGKQLVCVFVDTGLLRLNEADQVLALFEEQRHMRIIHVNAEAEFLEKLQGVFDPEAKRKIIGQAFITIFDREAAKIQDAKWLAQGTIYSDVIESAQTHNNKAKVIKSHHNVGGLPANMKLKLVEPLRQLFKDEVRKLGLALGLPHNMVYRHPFPGPGLGVRILGEVKKTYADILRNADVIFIDELHKSGWYEKVSQAFAVFLPVKSVGVVGDARQYEYVISLRAVQTIDFMTAHWAHLPYALLQKISTRIINEVRGVSRVVYDISDKPPATIEWE
jgi:GMP synthase (glutamine-hydrolysing)